MTMTRVILCAVPEARWAATGQPGVEGPTLGGLVADALAIERRMRKGVNLEDERIRYGLCCARIEALTTAGMQYFESQAEFKSVLASGRFPAHPLGVAYLDVLRQILDEGQPQIEAVNIRLGATFFPPGEIRKHAMEFNRLAERLGLADDATVKKRIAFFTNLALPHRCGVVELQSAFQAAADEKQLRPWELATGPEPPVQREEISEVTVVPDRESHGPPTHSRDERMVRNLRAQIRHAIAEPSGAVNFSNHRNDIIAKVLHEFVYRTPDSVDGPVEIRVLYADGSEGRPFPLRCLASTAEPEAPDALIVRAALMSMRHLEMDREVDMAWLRNRDVSKSRTLAETDEYCYTKTLERFEEVANDFDAFVLQVYHTGFEPAVVGFHRGLVRTLRDVRAQRAKHLRTLVVRPYLYRGVGRYEEGPTWC